MTTFNTVLNVILAAAVAFLLIDKFSGENSEEIQQVAETDTLNVEDMSQRIAYIDIDSLNAHYKLLDDNYEELDAFQRRAENSLRNQMNRAQERMEVLQQSIQTEEQYIKAQQEVNELEMQIENKRQEIANDLIEMETRMQTDLYERINSYLDHYNDSKGFDYVLGYQLGGQILYGQEALDITEEIITGLNQLYDLEKESASAEGATE